MNSEDRAETARTKTGLKTGHYVGPEWGRRPSEEQSVVEFD
jgi:hypothetical protein